MGKCFEIHFISKSTASRFPGITMSSTYNVNTTMAVALYRKKHIVPSLSSTRTYFDMVKVFKRLDLIGRFGVTTGRNYCGLCGSAKRMDGPVCLSVGWRTVGNMMMTMMIARL